MTTRKTTEAKSVEKVPVSERAALARLNRKLAKRGVMLKQCRADSRWHTELGNYYSVNTLNGVEARHVDLEAWARSEGALKPYEAIAG